VGTFLIAVLVFWVAPAWIAWDTAEKKNRGRGWGICLGWLGVVIACCLSRHPTTEELELARIEKQLHIREMQRRLSE
jgi:hypothetical protein